MLPLGQNYSKAVDGGKESLKKNGINDMGRRYPLVPWYSSVTPDMQLNISGKRMPTSYWRSNLKSAVCFTEALSKPFGSDALRIGTGIEIGL
jgi:hypothetical protein